MYGEEAMGCDSPEALNGFLAVTEPLRHFVRKVNLSQALPHGPCKRMHPQCSEKKKKEEKAGFPMTWQGQKPYAKFDNYQKAPKHLIRKVPRFYAWMHEGSQLRRQPTSASCALHVRSVR